MNYHYNNLLASYSKIEIIRELIIKKYFMSIFYQDIKGYIKDCDICLTSKTVCH